MKKIAFLLIGVCLINFSGRAQTINSAQQKNNESFQEFRNRILNNYNDFRKTILDHYADFLNGEWHEYESLNGLIRDETPKPQEPPRIDLPNVPEIPAIPDNQKKKPDEDLVADNKSHPKPIPEVQPQPGPKHIPEVQPQPEPKPIPEVQPQPEPAPEVSPLLPTPPTVVKPEPTIPPLPEIPAVVDIKPDFSSTKDGFKFSFFNMPMSLVDIDFKITESPSTPSEFSENWKALEAEKVADKMLPSIKKTVKELGLNDYLTYKYLESYVNSKFPKVKDSARVALVHYLLVNLGYDARLAVSTKGTPMLLIPFNQIVYGKTYLNLNNQRYYVFPPEGVDVQKIFAEKVLTCQLPTDVNTGNLFDLVVGELNIPVKPKKFDLQYGPLHLTGEMNENLIPLLYHYPQMPIEDYAKSNIQPGLRKELVAQVKEQLGNMKGDEGVEALLHFTQNAFEYATDDNFHGFEKPYFIEETLYYPKNDCEDRAIFYTYFLHNALGRDTQLVAFPGHEAATVVLKEPKNGVSYNYKGKNYYISDPTYIGASTGMVMPSYINVQPEIDYTY